MDQSDRAIMRRVLAMKNRVDGLRRDGLYFYNQPASELHGGAHVVVNGREMGMYASYSYLGLVGQRLPLRIHQDT
jgi:hypothetical protein